MQAYSTLKKAKFTKKKRKFNFSNIIVSTANENLKMLQDPQEERFRRAEFKREKMMSTIKTLFDMNNTSAQSGGDQYSILIQGIAGTQIIPNLAPAPMIVPVTRPSVSKPPKDPSKQKQQFGYKNPEKEQLEHMRKTLLEQTENDKLMV